MFGCLYLVVVIVAGDKMRLQVDDSSTGTETGQEMHYKYTVSYHH